MHAPHEFMKVQPCLAHDRHGGIKGIHQEALAAPHPAPQIHAARHIGAVQQLLQRVRAHRLELDPFVVIALQAVDGLLLRGIGLVATFGQGVFVVFADVHGDLVQASKMKKGRVLEPAPCLAPVKHA
ncbi:hypothetical protein D3C77_590860 [compost metagenome]